MKNFIFITAILLFFHYTASAQEDNISRFFSGDTLFYQNDTLPYLIYNGDLEADTADLPLVIFLHGAGERGYDNQRQLIHCTRFFMTDSIRSKYAFRMLVPQCGKAYRWVETDWTLSSHQMPEIPSSPMNALLHLIDSLIDNCHIDTTRIYILGISMGGFGVWDILQRRPELFAAAVPMCGGGDDAIAERLIDIPIRIFHGSKDKLVIPQRSINMFNHIRAAGGQKAELTLYPDLGHACWNRPFENGEVIQWLFQQKKPDRK